MLIFLGHWRQGWGLLCCEGGFFFFFHSLVSGLLPFGAVDRG